MANGFDFLGMGMMVGGGAVAAVGFFGKAAVSIAPQVGLSDTSLMFLGGASAAIGVGLTATSGSKSLF